MGPHTNDGHGTEAHTSDELRLLIDQSKESGEIQDSEHELFENVFQFNDRTVRQIMVPRTKIAALDVERLGRPDSRNGV